MTINLQTTLPPGFVPSGVDPSSLDAATRKQMETKGLSLEQACQLAGIEINDQMGATRLETIIKSLLTPPNPATNGSGKEIIPKLDVGQVMVDIYSVMALFQKCAQEMRDSSRMTYAAESQAQIASLKNAANEIRSAAAERLQQAIIQGSMQITGGLVSVGMGATSAVMGAKAIKAGVDTTAGAKMKNLADAIGGSAQGANAIIGGTGSIISAHKEQAAAEHDARRSDFETQAKAHEAEAQAAADVMRQMMDVIRDIREKIEGMDRAQSETARSIARNV